MKKYKCRVCGHVFESEEPAVCPVCGMSGDSLEEIK